MGGNLSTEEEIIDNSTENHLVQQIPVLILWILENLSSTICCNNDGLRWKRCSSIQVAIKMLPFQIGNNLSFP